jgi:opacity protein-like surface antigen
MLKFTAAHHLISPVIGAGVNVRHINNFGDVPSYLFNASTSANSVGFVAGAGVAFHAGPVSITPEVRYTHWQSDSLAQSLVNALTSAQNSTQVLVGFTF